MEFLKKHYEKVVLGVVLLGLTVAVAMLPIVLSSKREKLASIRESLINPTVKPLPPIDIAKEELVMQRLKGPFRLDFTRAHNLFNPVLWQKAPDGRLLKGGEVGAEALELTDTQPLYLNISFNGVSGTSYLVGVEDQSETKSSQRKKETLVSMKSPKKDVFTLHAVKGAPEKPDSLELELADGGDIVEIAPGKPFSRIVGYSGDFRYTLDQPAKVWRKQHREASLAFNGQQYKIIAITSTNAVISAPNGKNTTINLNAVTR